MKRYQEIINWIPVKLLENLRFSDLAKGSGNSDLTATFRKQRNKLTGSESKNATIISMKVNRKSGWIEFDFRTRSTPYPNDPNHNYSATHPETAFSITPRPSRTYIMRVRVLDFFKWLKTTPGTTQRDYSALTNTDIEDVLKVADVKVFCDCPSFHWQGMNYYLSKEFHASIFPTNIAPTDKKNNNGTTIGWKSRHNSGDGLICKHLQGVINNIHFFIPQMRQMIIKYLSKNITNK